MLMTVAGGCVSSPTEKLAEKNLLAVCRMRRDGSIVDANDACARLLGFETGEELIAHGSLDYFNHSDGVMISAALGDTGTLGALEVSFRKRDGGVVWAYQNIAIVDVEGEEFIDTLLLEITEQRQAVERFEYQTNHDALTELPNRSLFHDRLEVAIARSARKRSPVAVLFIDLDHFELINSTFGKGLADRVIKRLAQRISETLRLEDSAARFGSDEFAVILSDFGAAENTAMIAQRILDAISKPVVLEGHEIRVNASIGIAISPEDGHNGSTLVQNAASAMYRAKELGRNTYQLHQTALNERAFERSFLVANLRKAIDRREFALLFQPQVNVVSGRVECVEALLRWNHPELGMIAPDSFLSVAEDANLTVELGEWVAREASRQVSEWNREGMRNVRLAINLSKRQFRDPELAPKLQQALFDHHTDAKQIELEVSERILDDAGAALLTLASLRTVGAPVAIDDFGTGSLSIADLKRFSFDTLKIDPSFIQNITTQPNDAAIVDAIITMAKGLDMRVVAEGVENVQQMSHLRAHRCNDMQGFFFGRPIAASETFELLKMQH